MNITKAKSAPGEYGYPELKLVIDGHPAFVVEPKLTLLSAGIVILLDSEGYWRDATSAEYDPGDGSPPVQLRGATRDPGVIALVKRFTEGAEGDLLAA